METHNRRDFIKLTSLAVAGSMLPLAGCSTTKEAAIATGIPIDPSYKLKVGLIGCGGRGTGAANQALHADDNVELYAMADLFADQLENSLETLKRVHPDKIDVPEERQFTGFDSYQKVIDSGIDVVLLAAPPAFRPAHLEASVNADLHIFCEKPVAVDAPGYHRIIDAVDIAEQKKLSIVSGFCWRYHTPKREFFSRVLDGQIGEIRAIYNTYNTGSAIFRDRQPEWSEAEFQLRNWMYYNWLAGDHIVEQAVHSIDFMAWAMGDEVPLNAVGTGGRQVRTEPQYGHIFDHFAITYEYANGAKGFHMSRQQANCQNSYKAEIFGADGIGRADVSRNIHSIEGRRNWEFEGEANNMYQTQHDELFAAIRKGVHLNDGYYMAKSTMAGIMGRMAAYTGQRITWDQALNSKEALVPNSLSWDSIPTEHEVAMPGITPFV